jgi:6-phosphogluconolactonase
MSARPRQVQIHEDGPAAAHSAAKEFAALAGEASAAGRPFRVALTGGDSPRELYRLLATPEFVRSVDWSAVHLFWGDERCVPPAHPRSNFGMAWRLFISRVPIPPDNVHRMRGEMGPGAGAVDYEEELRSFGGDHPLLDLVYLGVGDDGHVASLFPFQLGNLLERDRWVVPALSPECEPRITLTLPVINGASRVRMLLPDAEQASLVRKVMNGPLDPLRLPAQLVNPVGGEQVWSLTRASAAEIETGR